MNRIEIVGLFTALDRLCEKNDVEGISTIVKAVLKEAVYANKDDKKKDKDKDKKASKD